MRLPLLVLVSAVALGAAGVLAALAVGLPPTARQRVMAALAPFGIAHVARQQRTGKSSESLVRALVDGPLGALGPGLTGAATAQRLQRWLDYAGNPPDWPVGRVIRGRGAGALGGVVAGLFFGTAWAGRPGALAGPVLGALLGFVLPDLLLYNVGAKRQERLVKTLPDVLDTLVIGVEAGLGLDAAMAQVAQYTEGPMAAEIHRLLQEMRIGVGRATALRALADRTTVTELRTFISALIQSGDLGIPVAGVLREHSRETRLKRRQRAEEQAQKVPVKILFPVLLCIFPAMFVTILGPGILNLLAAFKH